MKNDGKKKAGTQVDSNLLVLDIYIYINISSKGEGP